MSNDTVSAEFKKLSFKLIQGEIDIEGSQGLSMDGDWNVEVYSDHPKKIEIPEYIQKIFKENGRTITIIKPPKFVLTPF